MSRTQHHLMILMPSWVGDIVMATPALKLLRGHYRESKITAVTRPGLSPILAGLNTIDKCVEVDPKGLIRLLKSGRTLADLKPDQVLMLPNSMRSAILAYLSGASTRTGFRRQGRHLLLTESISLETDDGGIRTTLDEYIQLVESCTLRPFVESRTPELTVTEDERDRAQAVMTVDGDYVVMVPGANRLDKRWPTVRFARVAEQLSHEYGLRIVLTGSPAEAPLIRDVASQANCKTIDLACEGIGLGGLKAILQAAALVISNDTGPRHVAAALGTPVVSLFGPTDHRWTILPGVKEHRLLAEPFLPDTMMADHCTQTCRIERIMVEDVISAASRLLAVDSS